MQGGNFWEGAAIRLTVGLLNHAGKKLSEAIDGWLKDNSGQLQDKGINLEKLFKEVLKMKDGTVITADDAIKKFGIDIKLKDAINSIKLMSKGKIYVDWKNEGLINKLSYLNVKDGILNIENVSLKASSGGYYNGLKITGGNLQVDTGTFGKIYNNVFINNGNASGIISSNPAILTNKSYGF